LLNEKAVEFPRPAYTPEAKKAGLIGTVIVEILVNEQGYVESAKAIEGPEELRPAAVAAAMKARFMVRFQAGKPSKVSGTLKYDFPPK
jgi:protein TonB